MWTTHILINDVTQSSSHTTRIPFLPRGTFPIMSNATRFHTGEGNASNTISTVEKKKKLQTDHTYHIETNDDDDDES
jgi:hypothetical protein